jgi:PTS system nitrogen regulatory IIA component
MPHETMDLDQLAAYLRRDVREVSKLANRGHLPGRKVAGQWRFARAEINHWLETQLPGYTEEELFDLERAIPHFAQPELFISALLPQSSIAVPLRASTRASVLRELVRLAEQSGQVYDPDAILHAVQAREDMASTALANGVAIPHPRRPLASALGESIIALGRTASGLPFGAENGNLTDIFFLVCCRDDRTHLRVLARLSRLLLQPRFLDELRAAEVPADVWQLIDRTERELTPAK